MSNRLNRNICPIQKKSPQVPGKERAHIASFEVMNCALSHKRGAPFSQSTLNQFSREMQGSQNIRNKSIQGNRVTDRKLDAQIMSAMNAKNPRDKVLTNQASVDRMRRQWESVNAMEIDRNVKIAVRNQLSQVKDQNGNSIVRKNATIH